jgi:hypothetical protein
MLSLPFIVPKSKDPVWPFGHSYTYDAENRLTQVDGGNTANHAHDVEGRRVEKTSVGVVTNSVYDLPTDVMANHDSCGTC